MAISGISRTPYPWPTTPRPVTHERLTPTVPLHVVFLNSQNLKTLRNSLDDSSDFAPPLMCLQVFIVVLSDVPNHAYHPFY